MRRRATLALVVLSALSHPAAADDAASVTLPLKLPPAVEATEPVPAPQDVLAAPAAAERAPESANGAPPPVPQPKPSPPAKVVEMNPVDDMPGGKPIPTPPGGAPSVRCFVRDVMAFYDRTHVRCYNKVRGKIVFFAVDTSQPVTATVLEKALKGMQTGKPVTITYAPGTDLNPSNCDRKNCRRLLDIQF
jgi:hypothetical protein